MSNAWHYPIPNYNLKHVKNFNGLILIAAIKADSMVGARFMGV